MYKQLACSAYSEIIDNDLQIFLSEILNRRLAIRRSKTCQSHLCWITVRLDIGRTFGAAMMSQRGFKQILAALTGLRTSLHITVNTFLSYFKKQSLVCLSSAASSFASERAQMLSFVVELFLIKRVSSVNTQCNRLGLFPATDESRACILSGGPVWRDNILKSRHKIHRYWNISRWSLCRLIHQSSSYRSK